MGQSFVFVFRLILLHFCFQADAPSEEKRQQHQKELAQRLNDEARERLKGMKTDSGDKKSVHNVNI